MIDPWGINNISYYTNGLCSGLSNLVELDLFTNYYYRNTSGMNYKIESIFFKQSEDMKKGMKRNIIRSLEYIRSYWKIVNVLEKGEYDIIHIQWLLLYKFDKHFLKKIKKRCKKLILTAHNVIPHVNGDKYIKTLREIYGIFDLIVLHGEGIRSEFVSIFPEFKEKLYIQKIGPLNQSKEFDIAKIDNSIVSKINYYDKKIIFFGNLFYNKGVDRIVKIWIEEFSSSNHLLIVAGKKNDFYKELSDLEPDILSCENMIYINNYVEDNLLNYLIDQSDLIVLPYRHASMSGVLLTAAEFNKPVLCTNLGSLTEYIINRENSFVVESQDKSICEAVRYICESVSKEELKSMGKKLNEYITNNFNWDVISKLLVTKCYEI